MRYNFQNIEVSITLSISEIDNLYTIISGKSKVDQGLKDCFLNDLKTIVKKYRRAADLDLRCYDATDEDEKELEFNLREERINF